MDFRSSSAPAVRVNAPGAAPAKPAVPILLATKSKRRAANKKGSAGSSREDNKIMLPVPAPPFGFMATHDLKPVIGTDYAAFQSSARAPAAPASMRKLGERSGGSTSAGSTSRSSAKPAVSAQQVLKLASPRAAVSRAGSFTASAPPPPIPTPHVIKAAPPPPSVPKRKAGSGSSSKRTASKSGSSGKAGGSSGGAAGKGGGSSSGAAGSHVVTHHASQSGIKSASSKRLFDSIPPLVFDAAFESGNLASAVRVGPSEYELTLRDDDANGYNLWFYFKMTGMKVGTAYTLRITNYHKSVSLYRCGQRPLIHSQQLAAKKGLGWHRWDTGTVQFYRNKGQKTYSLVFDNFKFQSKIDSVHLAYLYPYTMTQLEQDVQAMSAGPCGFRVRREQLSHCSLQGRPCDVLVLTNPPDRAYTADPTHVHRRLNIVLTCRIHPGETSASWTLRGILQCLTQDNPIANALCDRCVFHIVPCLNPDGVVDGSYRRNAAGIDLNRTYAPPMDANCAPTILALREYLTSINATAARGAPGGTSSSVKVTGDTNHAGCVAYTPIAFFGDIHGISSDRGVMTYSFHNSRMSRPERLAVRAFPCLLSRHIPSFNFATSGFYGASEYRKTGVGALTVHCDFGVQHSYTIETSMCGPEPLGAHYSTADYMQIGHKIVAALNDYAGCLKSNAGSGSGGGGGMVPIVSPPMPGHAGGGAKATPPPVESLQIIKPPAADSERDPCVSALAAICGREAASHRTIYDACESGDLAAVSTHLATSPGCINDIGKPTLFGKHSPGTPIYWASYGGHQTVIGFLCQHGADPNEGNKAMKSTPLHCAAWNGHADCVSELILRGANPHVKNQDGLTPLDAALRDGRADTYAALQKPPTHSAAEALGPMSAKQRADLTKMRMQQFPVAAGVGISSPAAPPNYGKQAFSRFN